MKEKRSNPNPNRCIKDFLKDEEKNHEDGKNKASESAEHQNSTKMN